MAGKSKQWFRELIRLAPHTGEHWVAMRVSLSLGLPLLTLWATNSLHLSVFVAFGAFTSLYGRNDVFGDRIRMQCAAGASLLLAMFLGSTLSYFQVSLPMRVIAVAVYASAVALVAYGWHWHPPGALFATFAAGATATIPASAASFVHVAVVGGGTAVFSLFVTLVFVLFRPSGVSLERSDRRRAPFDRQAWAMAFTVCVGSVCAGLIGLTLIGAHWYWAMVAAVAALGGTQLRARVARGVQRLAGTLLGVGVTAGLLALHMPPLMTVLVAVLLQACAELFVGRNYALAMLFVTPLALLMIELALPADPGVLLRDRTLDTLIGVAVGTVVAVCSAVLRREILRSTSED